MNVLLNLTEQELGVVLSALSDRPHKEVVALINKIVNQVYGKEVEHG